MFAAAFAALATIPIGDVARAQDASSSDRIKAAIVVEVLKDLDYPADVDQDPDGDPRVTTTVDGHKLQVYFYDCLPGALEQRECNSFQFYADNPLRRPVAPQIMNKWNKEWRYVRAYLQQGERAGCPKSRRGCSAGIELDVLMDGTGGDPGRTFRLYLGIMKRRAIDFRKAIGVR